MEKFRNMVPGGLHQTRENMPNLVMLGMHRSIISMMSIYFHEIGHHLAGIYSFKNGDVLTPFEATYTKIEINALQKLALLIAKTKGKFNENSRLEFKGLVKEIADDILIAYTKGKWDPTSIEFKNSTIEELESIMRPHTNTSTYQISESGVINHIYTREGRNLELPAYGVEAMCMTILSNSLGEYIEKNTIDDKTSHGRADRLARYIIARNDRGENWYIPSYVDQT